jgi:microcystin-dependent protein
MPFNGSGVFQRVRNWVADATAGIKIRADYHDSEDDGFAAGLTNCITRDGQSTITQNIPFNSKRITGLADPVNPQDASTKAYTDTKNIDLTMLCPPGAVMDFATATAPAGWLVCDGQEISRTTYAALFAAIGTTWGVGNGSTTFNAPNLINRFRRHRDGGATSGNVGLLQASQNLSHTHSVTGDTGAVSADHTHHLDFMSAANDRSLDHLHGGVPDVSTFTSGGFVNAPGLNYVSNTSTHATGAADRALDHLHRIVGDTGGISANHSHHFAVTSAGGSADGSEARPLSATVLTCVKT